MNQNKLLFFHLPHVQKGGLPIIDNRNLRVLKKIFNNVQSIAFNPFESLNKKNKIVRIIVRILLLFNINNIYSTKQINITCLKNNNSNSIYFFSHSLFGFLIEYIKKINPNTFIITFIHNVESDYKKQIFSNYRTIYNFIDWRIVFNAEKRIAKYSDIILALNERDSIIFKKSNNTNANIITLPTTLDDRYNEKMKKPINTQNKLNLLFIGTYFHSNIEGIIWFIENIMPSVNVELHIVGMGMNKLSEKYCFSNNIHIIGEIDQKTLDSFYYNADIFVSTLFSGGGMKTKIAEAMMFSLPIIGTNEAFQGYDFDHSLIGINSTEPNKIISFINNVDNNRQLLGTYSAKSRQIFLENYSINTSVEKLNKLFENHK